jgi:hypothetical protein
VTGRFHLIMAADGCPAMHGWWWRETTARSKFATWVGSWGRPGVHITLVDEQSHTVLESWPDD